MHVVDRGEWDRHGRERGNYIGPSYFKAMAPHHTVTGFVRGYFELVCDRMRYLQALRPDLGYDIPYNFVIFAGADANQAWLAEGRGIGWTGAHTSGFNSSVHAASFWGNSITDPVEPAVLEAFRLVGRLMLAAGCPVSQPTLDHGQYPDQGTACAGTGIRSQLAVLQPPFNSPLTPQPAPPPIAKEYEVQFEPREPFGSTFTWPGYGNDAIAFDAGDVKAGDTISVELTGLDTRTRNITFIHPNGKQETLAVQWGLPVRFIANGEGWSSVVCGKDVLSYRDGKPDRNGPVAIRVKGRP